MPSVKEYCWTDLRYDQVILLESLGNQWIYINNTARQYFWMYTELSVRPNNTDILQNKRTSALQINMCLKSDLLAGDRPHYSIV